MFKYKNSYIIKIYEFFLYFFLDYGCSMHDKMDRK